MNAINSYAYKGYQTLKSIEAHQVRKGAFIAASVFAGGVLNTVYPMQARLIQLLVIPWSTVATSRLLSNHPKVARCIVIVSAWVFGSLTASLVFLDFFKGPTLIKTGSEVSMIRTIIEVCSSKTLDLGFALPIARELLSSTYTLLTDRFSRTALDNWLKLQHGAINLFFVYLMMILPLESNFPQGQMLNLALGGERGFGALKKLSDSICLCLENLRAAQLSLEAEELQDFKTRLTNTLSLIPEKEVEQTLQYLLDNIYRINSEIDTVLSYDELIKSNPFMKKALKKEIRQLSDLQNIIEAKEETYDQLQARFNKIRANIDKNVEDFEAINTDFLTLKKAIEDLSKQVRRNITLQKLKQNVSGSIQESNNMKMQEDMQKLFSRVWGTSEDGKKQIVDALIHELQAARSQRAATENNTQEDELSSSAYEHLTTILKTNHYSELQSILNVKVMDEDLFVEALKEIELSSRKDLFDKKIISKTDEITPNEILANLKKYVDERKKVEESLYSRISKAATDVKQAFSITQNLSQRISYVAYKTFMISLWSASLLQAPWVGGLMLLCSINVSLSQVFNDIPRVENRMERLAASMEGIFVLGGFEHKMRILAVYLYFLNTVIKFLGPDVSAALGGLELGREIFGMAKTHILQLHRLVHARRGIQQSA